MKTILLMSAGVGSRLGQHTSQVNKGQMTVGNKPVISYVIEKFTKEDHIIICVGYKGNYLKQVINAIYPDWNITFVDVDKYEGEGSGPGYSIIQARAEINSPFYFFCNDGIILDDINSIPTSTNTILTYPANTVSNPSLYRNVASGDGKAFKILPKGDPTPNAKPYIGIAYVKDWKDFFAAYDKTPDVFVKAGEVVGLNNLKEADIFTCPSWMDTGSVDGLEKAQKHFTNTDAAILEKPDEAIWFFDDKVVKFHVDKNFIQNRIARWQDVCDRNDKEFNTFSMPRFLGYSENTYTYEYAKGKVLSTVKDVALFKHFIQDYFSGLKLENLTETETEQICTSFYKDKTLKRIDEYLVKFEDADEKCLINGIAQLPAKEIINKVNFNRVAKTALMSKNFHGDFQMENILFTEPYKFTLLDIRQNFGKGNYVGDIYYDIGKIWHSFYINDHMIKDGLFSINSTGNKEYELDIHRSLIYTEYEETLKETLGSLFIGKDNKAVQIDMDNAELIMCLVILSFAALHTYPYSKFAFYCGKYLLNRWYSRVKDHNPECLLGD